MPTTNDSVVGPREVAPDGSVAKGSRDRLLGPDWRGSQDMAWTVQGDASGLHVLVARKSQGYGWSTLATLGDSSVDTDRWIANACLSASGRRLFVVYAPRTFTNDESLTTRGGFTAVVDMSTGRVRTLAERASLAYFNPGCGSGETAVFTQEGADGGAQNTRLLTVDGASAAVTASRVVSGQVTSAVPYLRGVAAARGDAVISLAPHSGPRVLTRSTGRVSRLTPLSDGSLVFMDTTESVSQVSSYAAGKTAALAKAPVARIDVSRVPVGGRAVILGNSVRTAGPLPDRVSAWGVPVGTEVSSTGEAAVTDVASPLDRSVEPGADAPMRRSAESDSALQVGITLLVRDTGATLRGKVPEGGARSQEAVRPGASTGSSSATAVVRPSGSATATVEAERSCSIPRNDASQQVYQPTPRQVEWAVDQAVQNNLKMTRPAGWKGSHATAAWTPQGMFPLPALTGGTKIPAPLVLGLFTQESNLWQASSHAVYGQTGNPLVGNYYGRAIYDADPGNDWNVVWDDADCGYGISQMTDGMVLAGREQPGQVAALPLDKQRAIAHDYASNIAAGTRLLAQKWNEVRAAGLSINNGDSTKLENWFYAIWAYNSGFHAQGSDPDGAWGLGWLNNPANPRYDENRWTFLDSNSGGGPADAANPTRWPYPEKVIGFATYSFGVPEYDYKNSSGVIVHDTYGVGYTGVAWWNDVASRSAQKPGLMTFCDARNSCGKASGASEATCSFVGDKCWVHYSATWKSDCPTTCGNGSPRFNTTYPEQGDGWAYPPACTSAGLPVGALVVDDVSASGVTPQASHYGCSRVAATAGTFAFTFASDAGGSFPSKVDTHQIGGGFDGHFWFAHTRPSSDTTLRVTGKWTFTTPVNGWGRVLVHMPDHGAHTSEASYQVYRGAGTLIGGARTKTRVAAQRTGRNGWVSLGVMQFAGYPTISLTNLTKYGIGDNDIAWDAVAIAPLSAKPSKFVVALGDSYSSGEAAQDTETDYFHETNVDGDYRDRRNACHRSRWAWSRRAVLAGNLTETIGAREDRRDPTLDYHLIACSGAQTENILSSADGALANAWGQRGARQFANSLPQLDQGYLDENTSLVTVSIGGNDARFGQVIGRCDNPVDNPVTMCQDVTLDGDSQPLRVSEPELIKTKVRTSIETTLKEIHRVAPNAKIVLMGYPLLIDTGACTLDLNSSEVAWINDTTTLMRDQMQLAARNATSAGAPTTFADPIGDFAGRGACAPDAAITHEVVIRTEGDEPVSLDSPASQESFHPNVAGTGLYANALNRALRSIGQ